MPEDTQPPVMSTASGESRESSESTTSPNGGTAAAGDEQGEADGDRSLDDLLAGFDTAQRAQRAQTTSFGVVSPFAPAADEPGR